MIEGIRKHAWDCLSMLLIEVQSRDSFHVYL